MSGNEGTESSASRRGVVCGLLGLGIGAPLLAACGSQGGAEAATKASGPIAKTSEIPVGGAKIFASRQVMVSQPTAGAFKAFSTICTHQQCNITQLNTSDIECGCHHSRFAIADGSVVHGPANRPLQELKVSVSGGEVSVS